MEQLEARIEEVSNGYANLPCNVTKILGFGVVEAANSDGYGTRWAMMEYASGQSLEQIYQLSLVEQAPQITVQLAYQITEAVLRALAEF